MLTLWRDALTTQMLAGVVLNERQRRAIAHVKSRGRITNSEYQTLTATTKKTSSRDLDDLVKKGILARVGTTGRGTSYTLSRQRATKKTKGTSRRSRKGDIKGTEGTRRKRRSLKSFPRNADH